MRGDAASAQVYKARLLLLGRERGRCSRPMPRQFKKQERNKTMKKIISAATAAALCALAGCYIGKAEFKMRLSA